MTYLRHHPIEVLGLVAFTVLSLLLTLMIGNTLSQQTSATQRQYVADFTDASGLKPGDEVRIAGVRVGRVDGRELHDGLARVTFSLDGSQAVRSDTRVKISYLNMLGQRYLALDDGDEPGTRLPAGSVIGTDRTEPALDLTALFNAFKPLFDALDPDDVNLLATQVVEALQGQGPTLSHLTAQTAELTSHLADRDEIISRVIDNVTVVMTSMADRREEISGIVTGLDSLVGKLADDADQIDASLRGIDGLSRAVGGLVDETGDPLTADVVKMRDLGTTLVGNQQEMRAALKGAPGLLDGYARSMSYGSFLNIHICNLSIALQQGLRVAGTAGLYSEVCR
jgi:phospholipid/cholesterol/gamma-HCH transport system substrate-binding protein